MKFEWKKVSLSDIVTFRNGKKRPKGTGNIPVYGGNGILDFTNEFNSQNCIAIGRVGAYCGSVFRERQKCWVSDNAICCVANEYSDIIFDYYLLKSLHLNQRHIGTSQPLLTQKILNKIEVLCPPLEQQREIGIVLSKFDDKFELNQKINENLERQMQAMFNSLFIENADSLWPMGTICDLGTVIGGSTPSKSKAEYYTDKGIAWITPKDLSVNRSKFISHGENDISELGLKSSSATIMPEGTVLFSSRAPIGYIAIADGEVTTNQGFKSVVPKPEIGTAYVYYFLKNNLPIIEGLASGSTFKEVSGSVMKSVPAQIPDDETLVKFNDFCGPLFAKQRKLEEENRILAEIRDTLLPKLMAGEIKI